MGTEFFGDLEPSLKELLAEVRSGAEEVEAVVGCSTVVSACQPVVSPAIVVGYSHSAESEGSGTQATCRGVADGCLMQMDLSMEAKLGGKGCHLWMETKASGWEGTSREGIEFFTRECVGTNITRLPNYMEW